MGNQSGTLAVADFPGGANARELTGSRVPSGPMTGVGAIPRRWSTPRASTRASASSPGWRWAAATTPSSRTPRGRWTIRPTSSRWRRRTRSLPLPSPDLGFSLFARAFSMDAPTSDIWLARTTASSECPLTSGTRAASSASPSAGSAGLVFWADNYDAATLSAEGWLTDPADCRNESKKRLFVAQRRLLVRRRRPRCCSTRTRATRASRSRSSTPSSSGNTLGDAGHHPDPGRPLLPHRPRRPAGRRLPAPLQGHRLHPRRQRRRHRRRLLLRATDRRRRELRRPPQPNGRVPSLGSGPTTGTAGTQRRHHYHDPHPRPEPRPRRRPQPLYRDPAATRPSQVSPDPVIRLLIDAPPDRRHPRQYPSPRISRNSKAWPSTHPPAPFAIENAAHARLAIHNSKLGS